MNEPMNPAVIEAVEALAKIVREDPRYAEYEKTAAAYNSDDAMHRMITEYNVHQTALAEEYAKTPREDVLINTIQKRIDTLYDEITNADAYQNFVRAKEEWDALLKSISDELDYRITGRRACTHDCSSCHADCASKSAENNSAHN